MKTMHLLAAIGVAVCLAPLTIAHSDDGTGNIACPIDSGDIQSCKVRGAVLPDLMTVVPKHLSIQNKQQAEILRFSNGLANLGEGPWWLEPGAPDPDDTATCQAAYQLVVKEDQFPDRQILALSSPAPEGTYSARCQKGKFDYHETHNHWHIANVGNFKICRWSDFAHIDENGDPAVDGDGFTIADTGCEAVELDDGHAVGIKFTFCLIDWYKLADNSPSSDSTRNFWDCVNSFQGITPQWVDQYHQATDGQDIEITGLPEGDYVLVSSVNSKLFNNFLFEEMDTSNNSSWVVFSLTRANNPDSASNRNANITIIDDACGEQFAYYEDKLRPAAEALVNKFHGGDESVLNGILDGMCGAESLNR